MDIKYEIDLSHYYGSHMVRYDIPPIVGYADMEVLPFLYGRPWDEVSYCWIYAVNPTSIRVIKYNGSEKCDARRGRVTVYMSETGTIEKITQEVTIGISKESEHGEDMMRLVGIV